MMWANISKCPRKVKNECKHESESSMIANGSAVTDRDSPQANSTFDINDTASGELIYLLLLSLQRA